MEKDLTLRPLKLGEYVKIQVSGVSWKEGILSPWLAGPLCLPCLPAVLLIFDHRVFWFLFAICLTLWDVSSLGTGSSLSWSLSYPWQPAPGLNTQL